MINQIILSHGEHYQASPYSARLSDKPSFVSQVLVERDYSSLKNMNLRNMFKPTHELNNGPNRVR